LRSAPIFLWRRTIRITEVEFEWAILGVGICVWAVVLTRAIFRRQPLALAQRVDPSAMRIGPHTFAALVALFLVAPQILFAAIKLYPPVPLAAPSLQSLADSLIAGESAKTILIVAIAIAMIRQRWTSGFFVASKKTHWLAVIPIAVAIYAAGYPLVNCLLGDLGVIVVQEVLHWPCPAEHSAVTLLTDATAPLSIKTLAVISATLISPISEELFFRGLIQNAIVAVTGRARLAIVLGGVVFGVMHVPLYPHVPALAVLGMILGWSYYRFNTLAVPIATHIIFNTATLILLALSAR